MNVFGIILLFSFSVFAANKNIYDMKLELSLDGKPVSSPRIIVEEGRMATVTTGGAHGASFIEVVAEDSIVQAHKGILMKFVVGTEDSTGIRTVVSRAQVFTKENESVQITTANDGTDKEQMSLSVIVQKM